MYIYPVNIFSNVHLPSTSVDSILHTTSMLLQWEYMDVPLQVSVVEAVDSDDMLSFNCINLKQCFNISNIYVQKNPIYTKDPLFYKHLSYSMTQIPHPPDQV